MTESAGGYLAPHICGSLSDYIIDVEESGDHRDFRRIRDGANYFHRPLPFDQIIADKKTNMERLQLADLTGRAIGLTVARPDRPIERGRFWREVLPESWDTSGRQQAGHRADGVSVYTEITSQRRRTLKYQEPDARCVAASHLSAMGSGSIMT